MFFAEKFGLVRHLPVLTPLIITILMGGRLPAVAQPRGLPPGNPVGHAGEAPHSDLAPVSGRILVVDCHGTYGYATIQSAINAAIDGDFVEVLPNDWTPEKRYFERIDFLGKAITVRGQAPSDPAIVGATIIDGGRGGSVVAFANGETANSVLDCLTITHGQAEEGGGITITNAAPTIRQCTIVDNSAGSGGGIFVGGTPSSSSVSIQDCTFQHNNAGEDGGGLNNEINGSVVLANCKFTENSAIGSGGGMFNHASEFSLTDCSFTSNIADSGGGLVADDAAGSLSRCQFIENSAVSLGGGMWVLGIAPLTFTECAFRRNSADEGGGFGQDFGEPRFLRCVFEENSATENGGAMYGFYAFPSLTSCILRANTARGNGGGMYVVYISFPTLTDCVLTGNTAISYGGAIYSNRGGPALVNCTVHANTASRGGGLYYDYRWDQSVAKLANTILWGDVPDEIHNVDISVLASYCDIQGGWSGVGNLSVDPQFYLDYHLVSTSPCIDQGEPHPSLPPGWVDIDGEPRIFNGRLDIGADEYNDCNSNGRPDYQEVADGSSPDCNYNVIPDSCERDCNLNGIPDDCDIASGVSNDCDHNGVPDECDPDCNHNGLPDACDIAAGHSNDCNENGVPDECDIGSGTSADANRNSVPDECELSRLYVNPRAPGINNGADWHNAYHELRDAMRHARLPNIQEVWVAAGTYTPAPPGGNREASFTLRSGLAIYGCFAGHEIVLSHRDPARHITILSGDLNGDDGPTFQNTGDNSYHVVYGRDVDAAAVLDEFTITGGHADGSIPYASLGGGIFCDGSPMIKNCQIVANQGQIGAGAHTYGFASFRSCRFAGNVAHDYGGGLDAGRSVSLTDCTFVNNSCSTDNGGGLLAAGELEATNCLFEKNTAGWSGGGIASYALKIHLSGCRFIGNGAHEGGAVKLDQQHPYAGPATIRDCLFVANASSEGGGAMYIEESAFPVEIDGCQFTANQTGGNGGALWSPYSSWEISRSRFVGNVAAAIGGAMANEYYFVALRDCLLVGNKGGNGGGVWCGAFAGTDVLTVANCTVADNSSVFPSHGGGLSVQSGNAIVNDTILWGNRAATNSSQDAQLYGATVAQYDCIENLLPGYGEHNLGENPRFARSRIGRWTAAAHYDSEAVQTTLRDSTADWETNELAGRFLNPNIGQFRQAIIVSNTAKTITVWGDYSALGADNAPYTINDYHLTRRSPCIDAGDPGFVPGTGETDIDDDPRVVGGHLDIGADEFCRGAVCGRQTNDAGED